MRTFLNGKVHRATVTGAAAAHLVHEGDIVIILEYVTLMEEEIATHSPRLVQVDSANKIVNISRPSVIGVPIGY